MYIIIYVYTYICICIYIYIYIYILINTCKLLFQRQGRVKFAYIFHMHKTPSYASNSFIRINLSSAAGAHGVCMYG